MTMPRVLVIDSCFLNMASSLALGSSVSGTAASVFGSAPSFFICVASFSAGLAGATSGFVSFAVPGIKRMVAEHVTAFLGEIVLANVVNVFVMTPRKKNVVQTTVLLIHAGARAEARIAAVRILGEELREDDFLRVSTTGGEGV